MTTVSIYGDVHVSSIVWYQWLFLLLVIPASVSFPLPGSVDLGVSEVGYRVAAWKVLSLTEHSAPGTQQNPAFFLLPSHQ